jgi:rhodanese-related sulfurtransferase
MIRSPDVNFMATKIKNIMPMFVQTIFTIIISILSVFSTAAAETPNLDRPKVVVPEMIAGVNTVSAEQVIKSLTSDSPPILVDARISKDRDYGYIETSISLPDIETNCSTLKAINADKEKHMMFYCNGIQCGRSVVSIKVARSCGYHNLSWFRGGFAEWKDKGYQYVSKQ